MSAKVTKRTAKKKVWFKTKSYGWGWYPAAWQGWIMLGSYTFALIIMAVIVGSNTSSGVDFFFYFLLPALGLTTLFMAISYKTGQKPGGRWGKRK